MAITTFTAAQVLTAAQMNAVQSNDFNQTVSTKTVSYTLVAADKGTRIAMNSASATTITVNTSLFTAGDTLQLLNISSGVCTVTAGTATVSSAGSLAIPANGGGTLYFTSAGVSIFFPSAVTATASGLTLISATTIGTTVASVTVSSAFSATFDNYLISVEGGIASGNNSLNLTLGATASNYVFAGFNIQYNAGQNITVSNGTSSFNAGFISANGTSLEIVLGTPFLARRTTIRTRSIQADTSRFMQHVDGFLNDATSYTAFTLTTGAGTMTGGTIRVYGYANS